MLNTQLSDAQTDTLTKLLHESDISQDLISINGELVMKKHQDNARQHLLNQLLDRHGTGRILFRNSRNTIKGFPERKLLPTALTLPEQYHDSFNDFY